MYYTVYKITNKLNGKFYIGKHKTKDLNDDYMGSGKLIKAAIKKHGIENFEKEILQVFDCEAKMNEAEKSLVVLNEYSYNLCPGGEGGWGYINNNIDVSSLRREQRKKEFQENPAFEKEKMVLISKKAHVTIKHRFPQGLWNKKTHSDESKKKMAEKAKKRLGSLNSQYGTCWITNGYENIKIPKEKLDEYLNLGYTRGRICKKT
jgi:group I intron endonuclease